MAKFCQNCGSTLTEGEKFCTGCGTPVASTETTEQPQQTKSEARQSQEFAKKNGAGAKQVKSSKKNGRGGGKFLVILLAIVIGLACFFGFRDGGWLRRSNSYDAQYMQSLLDYAQQLEKDGNSEAAAAVYELISKGGGAELIQKAHIDNSAIEKIDEVEQIEAIFDNTKGGDGK